MTEAVLAVMARVFNTPVAEGDTYDTLAEWDSLAHMELVMALEEAFDVQFRTDELTELLTVPLIVEAIERGRR